MYFAFFEFIKWNVSGRINDLMKYIVDFQSYLVVNYCPPLLWKEKAWISPKMNTESHGKTEKWQPIKDLHIPGIDNRNKKVYIQKTYV